VDEVCDTTLTATLHLNWSTFCMSLHFWPVSERSIYEQLHAVNIIWMSTAGERDNNDVSGISSFEGQLCVRGRFQQSESREKYFG